MFAINTIGNFQRLIWTRRLLIASNTNGNMNQSMKSHTVKKLRLFLNLCNVLPRLFPKYAQTAAPINHIIENDQSNILDDAEQREMRIFERKLTLLPVPVLLYLGALYRLDIDEF